MAFHRDDLPAKLLKRLSWSLECEGGWWRRALDFIVSDLASIIDGKQGAGDIKTIS